MTRTRVPPPIRPISYTPPRRVGPARNSGASRPYTGRPRRLGRRFALRVLLRPLAFLLVTGGAIAAATALLFLLVPLLIVSALSLFGFGAALLLPGAGVLAWRWRRLGSRGFFRAHWRHLLGGLLLYVGGLGLAALARPEGLGTWGVAWSEASFGGLLGQAILGEPGASGFLRSLAMLLAGVALVVPGSLRIAGIVLRRIWGFIVSLRLPQRSAVLARFALAQSRSAVTKALSTRRPTATEGRGPLYDAELFPEQAVPSGRSSPLDESGTTAARQAPTGAALPIGQAGIQSTLLPIVAGEQAPFDFAQDKLRQAQDTASSPNWNRWEQPTLALLETAPEPEAIDQTQRARQIEDALASYGVEGAVVQIHVGPAVTQFGVEPGWDRKYREVRERDSSGRVKLDKDGSPKARQEEVSRTRVKVERISGLSNNLAMALAAQSVRIEAPVPGQKIVGIEVPNPTPGLVTLRSVIETPAFQRLQSRSRLALAMGKGVSGDPVVADLSKMPHLLIAGATGSGKSVCINSIICCLLMHASPDEVRLLMIDPKRVELVPYNPIPHLLGPVIVDTEKVVGTLHWLTKEMEGRYRKFAAAGVRNIEGYNHSPKVHGQLPYWILIIDELADLMMVAPYEVERGLCRLAQLARATGIHLVVATQRPSVDVVTGLIKANFPTRVSFAVTSHIDSRTILDGSGAEKLLGRGDMLYMPTDAAKPKRVQGTYVSDTEVERLVKFWSDERFRFLRPPQHAEEMELAAASGAGSGEDEPDVLMERARELAESSERISISFLQRRLRVGYPRAARLMEALKEEGYGDPTFAAGDDF